MSLSLGLFTYFIVLSVLYVQLVKSIAIRPSTRTTKAHNLKILQDVTLASSTSISFSATQTAITLQSSTQSQALGAFATSASEESASESFFPSSLLSSFLAQTEITLLTSATSQSTDNSATLTSAESASEIPGSSSLSSSSLAESSITLSTSAVDPRPPISAPSPASDS